MTPLDIALGYIERGWNPVPIPYRAKRPVDNGWHQRVIEAGAARQYFNGQRQNVGVQLGPSSRGLTDADLDCREAIAIAPYVLPKTSAIFGRPSKRASHRLYYTDLSISMATAAIAFDDPKTKSRMLELRIGGGGMGAQTVFPGSTHEEGERIEWEENGAPADVDDADLLARMRTLAAYTLLSRHWPQVGGKRHQLSLALGGFLARSGKTPAEARLAVEAITRAANDPQWQDRLKAAEDAAVAHRAGKHACGFPALKEAFGAEIADKVAEWIGYDTQAESASHSADDLRSVCAADVKMRGIVWLWPERFAIGKLGIIAGLPDEGKGQILAYIIATLTTEGGLWPCGEGHAPLGNIVMLTAEDDLGDTVVPRLVAAGANLSRVHFIEMVVTGDTKKERMFSLISDLDKLKRKIEQIGNVIAVFIDPVSAYLGVKQIDSFRTNDVRSVLGPVVDMAAKLRTSFLAIMHFNKKTDVTNALLRISDSLAYGAAARHVYAVINDAENKRKLFVKAKNNLAKHDQQSLAYHFGFRKVGFDNELNKEIWAPCIEWEPKPVDVTAGEAMEAATGAKPTRALNSAMKFLREFLANGPQAQKDIEEAAKANGFSWATIRRAKDEIGNIEAKLDGEIVNGKHKWRWHLVPVAPRWSD
jgi:hypothetical protein